jgi:hypothetical protein
MAIQTFTAAQVLTAAQMNTLQANDYNQTVATKTASYTLVAADKGTRVVMNVASANTVTVNTSLFSAGDTLVIQNIGAGVTTVTAGTATVSSAGPLTIPQYGSGTLYFTSAGVSLWFPSAGPTASSGLTFISGASLSGNSQTFSSAFSATYDSYMITFLGILSAASTPTIRIRLGSSTTLTYNVNYSTPGNAQTVNSSGTNASIIDLAGINTTQEFNMIMAVGGPFLSQNTIMFSEMTQATQFFNLQCNDQSTTSFTAFTLSLSGANTFAAGSVKIYGYANS